MIKVLHKSLNILEYLSKHPEGDTLTNIAKKIGEKNTTTSNIVQVLAKRNYLERKNGRWKLGIGAFALAGRAYNYDEALCAAAEPILCRLAEETKSTVAISIWRNNDRYLLYRVADESEVTVNRNYVERGKVYTTVTGMMLFSCQNDDTVDNFISMYGVRNNPTPNHDEILEFKTELLTIKQMGYYQGKNEQVLELATPVYSSDGSAKTAIGLFVPRFRVADENKILDTLILAAKELENELEEISNRY